jgi:hypothetical protein
MGLGCDVSFAGVGNNLDGEPSEIQDGAKRMTTAGNQLIDASHAVDKLVNSSDEITSDAFKAIGEKGVVATKQLRAAGMRYQGMARALQEFAGVLDEEQRKARAAVQRAQAAKQRRDAAKQNYENARKAARTFDKEAQKAAVDHATKAVEQHKAADCDYQKEVKIIRDAASRVQEANKDACSKLVTASDNAGLDDSLFDKLKDFVSKVVNIVVKIGKWIWDHIDEICMVLDIVSFVLAFIPGLNAIAGALKTLTMVAKLLSKAKAWTNNAKAVLKAIKNPTGENIATAVTEVGGTLLSDYAGKKITKFAKKKLGGKAGAYADKLLKGKKGFSNTMKDFSKAMPGLAKSLPAGVGRTVFKTSETVLNKAKSKAIEWGKSTIVGMFKSKKPQHA